MKPAVKPGDVDDLHAGLAPISDAAGSEERPPALARRG